jgi:hypothetical protein
VALDILVVAAIGALLGLRRAALHRVALDVLVAAIRPLLGLRGATLHGVSLDILVAAVGTLHRVALDILFAGDALLGALATHSLEDRVASRRLVLLSHFIPPLFGRWTGIA